MALSVPIIEICPLRKLGGKFVTKLFEIGNLGGPSSKLNTLRKLLEIGANIAPREHCPHVVESV